MKTSLYFQENFVDVWFDHTCRLLVIKWFNLTTREHLKKAGEIHLDALQNLKTRVIILDLSAAKGLYYPSAREYFIEELFPESREKGIEICYMVPPKNPLSRYAVLKFLEMAENFEFIFEEVETLEQAIRKTKEEFCQ